MGFQGTFKGTLKENFDRMMNPRKFLNEMDQTNINELDNNSNDIVGKIIQWENGEMTDDETIDFFSELITSGQIRGLQGVYGRTAQSLIDAGYLDRSGKVLMHTGEMDESVINEVDNVNSVISTIKKVKNSLINKWKQKGGYENFGDKEYRALCAKFKYDPYGTPEQRNIAKMLDSFAEWAMNYDGSGMDESNIGNVTEVAMPNLTENYNRIQILNKKL